MGQYGQLMCEKGRFRSYTKQIHLLGSYIEATRFEDIGELVGSHAYASTEQ